MFFFIKLICEVNMLIGEVEVKANTRRHGVPKQWNGSVQATPVRVKLLSYVLCFVPINFYGYWAREQKDFIRQFSFK